MPLLNTIILLSSGASVTWAHHAVVAGSKEKALYDLAVTTILAVISTCLQGFEYIRAPFSMSDSVYDSVFFMATGFHGFHVISFFGEWEGDTVLSTVLSAEKLTFSLSAG